MTIGVQRITVEEFERFVELPENQEKAFEFIGGEIVEVPSNAYCSEIAFTIGFHIKLYLREHNLAGHITGEAGGYKFVGERYAPDVAYMSAERQAELAKRGYNPIPPELVVEVVSPDDAEKRLLIKVANYLAAGTVVWVVYPETRHAEIYAPGQPVQIIDYDGVLDGGAILPGFTLPIKDIFPEDNSQG